jgi:hypothetical protein
MTGVGPVEAAVALTAALARLEAAGDLPDMIVSLGSCGSRVLEHAAVYQASSVAYRDMDASPLGFPKGATPLLDQPAVLPLPCPVPGVPTARLSTGANVVSDGAWNTIPPAVGRPNVDDRNGAVAGVVRDCGTESRNPWAIVHATVGIAFNEGSVLSYFNGNPDNRLPLAGRDDSNLLGTFAAIDLPAGPNRVAPIICAGECSNREDLVFAGGKNVFQTPKSVIIATFEGFFAP